ncbi:MAG: thymidine phosphorylase [Ahniella sp.]|nr:thymidine phosphorylase [Ahniella sp.]
MTPSAHFGNPQQLIAAARDGMALNAKALQEFVCGMADGRTTEGQMAAFAMAVRCRGLNTEDTTTLTLAMRDSGDRLTRADLGTDRPLLDKHSTGGVGDATSLLLAPMLAACGAAVPMVSGRGLGFTGGTLDKLSALPGYRFDVDLPTLRATLASAGCAIVGAGHRLAPSDRELYAVRDVTATVDALPLIVASILSKKLAVELDALVLDVKCGSGALFTEEPDAIALAEALVQVASVAGLCCAALITDMGEPLLPAIGNATELNVVLDLLRGDTRAPRFIDACLLMGSEVMVLGGMVPHRSDARRQLQASLESGLALQCFARMTRSLGCEVDLEQSRWRAETAPVCVEVLADQHGVLTGFDARALGELVVSLGGGRTRADAGIDTGVGLSHVLPRGSQVEPGTPLMRVLARTQDQARLAVASARDACLIGPEYVTAPVLRGERRP